MRRRPLFLRHVSGGNGLQHQANHSHLATARVALAPITGEQALIELAYAHCKTASDNPLKGVKLRASLRGKVGNRVRSSWRAGVDKDLSACGPG